MALCRVALIVLASLVSLAAAAEVVELNDSNFEHLTQASSGQTTGKWLIKFYAPWCGHCKKLAPLWEELALKLEEEEEFADKGINVAKLDATQNRETAKRFDIRGYPSLLYLADRKVFRYQGPRTVDDFAAFVTKDYVSEKGEPVPSPPSWVELQRKFFMKFIYGNEFLRMLLEDFEHIIDLRKNAAAVLLGIGAIVGFLAGLLVVRLSSSSGDAKSKKTKAE